MIKPFISGLLLILFLFVLNTKFGAVPPMGKLLDPQGGFWANAETAEPGSEELRLPGLKNEVSVHFDERRVPHIFAENDHDLYFAQGYITAKDRLFQMEIQTYDAAGRLSEFIGEGLLNRDLMMRRLGMTYGAEKYMEELEKDSMMSAVIQAYSDGVNAYISSLSPDEYPVEYKILDSAPEKWDPVKSAFLLKNMTYSLAGFNRDVTSSNSRAYLGDEYIEKFFNRIPELNDPIIPTSRKWDFKAEVPEPPKEPFVPSITESINPYEPNPLNGSNNWAVSGAKTASGYPILSNDPHLNMTLPAIWYEMQLSVDSIHTYGVTLPGAPAIIIGFNEDVAWGATNVGSDVMDWYEVKFRDETKKEYWHDGKWKPTTTRIEEIKIRGKETRYDTLIFTHHGPVQQVNENQPEEEPVYHALRWIAHEPSNDLKTFYELNRAKNYNDYEKALKHFMAPAQNFVYADKHGDIALWVNGKLPKKWKYQGREVSDGTDPLYDWHGWIPREQNPWVKNPQRGFVSSANQESAAPDYPYYLDDNFAPYERGRRINELLAQMQNITADDMQKMQMDSYSYHAAQNLPFMMEYLESGSLNEIQMAAFEELSEWDFINSGDEIAPSVFKEWWNVLVLGIFNDEFDKTTARLRWPPRDQLAEVLKNEPDLKYIDSINSPDKIEDLSYIMNSSFKTAVERLSIHFGEYGETWQWKNHNNTSIKHIAQIPGLGRADIPTDGGPESINAISGSHGPSWRMVVELGPEVKARGVYPGGSSGNPGSPNYDAFVETWRSGDLYELKFMREEPETSKFKYVLKPVE